MRIFWEKWSRDSHVSYAPGSQFTVYVNLEALATAFKTTLFEKSV